LRWVVGLEGEDLLCLAGRVGFCVRVGVRFIADYGEGAGWRVGDGLRWVGFLGFRVGAVGLGRCVLGGRWLECASGLWLGWCLEADGGGWGLIEGVVGLVGVRLCVPVFLCGWAVLRVWLLAFLMYGWRRV